MSAKESKAHKETKDVEVKVESQGVYPSWRYHQKHAPHGEIVHSLEEEKALAGKGWVESPAEFVAKD